MKKYRIVECGFFYPQQKWLCFWIPCYDWGHNYNPFLNIRFPTFPKCQTYDDAVNYLTKRKNNDGKPKITIIRRHLI